MPNIDKIIRENDDGSHQFVKQVPGSGSKTETSTETGSATSATSGTQTGTRTTTKAGHNIVTVSARPETDTLRKTGEHYGILVRMRIPFQNKEPVNPTT